MANQDGVWQLRDGLLLANASGSGLDDFLFNVGMSMDAAHQVQSAASASAQVASIIFSSINIVAALTIAAIVCWDCYGTARAKDADFHLLNDLRATLYSLRSWTLLNSSRKPATGATAIHTRSSWRSLIDITHVFPLVLSIGIMVQGMVFVAAQAHAFGGPFKQECASIAGAMLPALFIVPYIQLIFGLETAFQALRPRPFAKRFAWTFPICLAVVIICLVVTYSITRIRRPFTGCVASLFWFLQPWSYGCLVVLLIITLILLFCVLVIVLQLHRTAMVPTAEREAAADMVLYLCLGSVLNVFIIPFFVSVSFQSSVGLYGAQVRSSMVAMVVDNLTGVFFGMLYLYLRYIKHAKMALQSALVDFEDQKPMQTSSQIRVLGSICSAQTRRPTPPPKTLTPPESSLKPPVVEASCEEKPTIAHLQIHESTPCTKNIVEDSQGSFQPPDTPTRRVHARKDSYSLFPAQRNDSPVDIRPMGIMFPTFDNPFSTATGVVGRDVEFLPLPPKIHIPGSLTNHGGSLSSLISSATVQIGLETSTISEVNDISPPSTPRTPHSNDDDDSASSHGSPFTLSDAVFISRLPQFARSPEMQYNAKRSPIIESRSYTASLPPHSPISVLDFPRSESFSSDRDDAPLNPSPVVYNPPSLTVQNDERIGASIATILEGQSTHKAAAWI